MTTDSHRRDPWLSARFLSSVLALVGCLLLIAIFDGGSSSRAYFKAAAIVPPIMIIYRLIFHVRYPYALLASRWAAAEPQRFLTAQLADVRKLQALSPQLFEDAIAQLYARLGYGASRTPYSGDKGWDVLAERPPEKLLIECKHFAPANTVGRPVLQKLHSAVITERATRGVVVTTARFSRPAKAFAQEVGIELVDGPALAALMRSAYTQGNDADRIIAVCPRCGKRTSFDSRVNTIRSRCPDGHSVRNRLSHAIEARANAEAHARYLEDLKGNDPAAYRLLQLSTKRRRR